MRRREIRIRWLRVAVVLLALGLCAEAGARERPSQRLPILTGRTAEAEKVTSPKSVPVLQRTFYVLTEFTEAGLVRRRAETSQTRTYAVGTASYRALGEDTVVDWKPRGSSVERAVKAALSEQRLEPAAPNQAADLTVALHWGSHQRGSLRLTASGPNSRAGRSSDPTGYSSSGFSSGEMPRAVASPVIPKVNGVRIDGASDVVEYRGSDGYNGGGQYHDYFAGGGGGGSGYPTSFSFEPGPIPKRNLLERTALFCGEDVARWLEQATVFEPDTDAGRTRAQAQLRRLAAEQPGVEFLFRTLNADLCYVVVSAFDRGPGATGKPVLLWRTKVTMPREYRRLTDAVSDMIAVAGPYLGQNTGCGLELLRTYDRRTGVLVGASDMTPWIADETDAAAVVPTGGTR